MPGSLNHLVPAYCALEFFIGALGCFPVSNNAALFAEVGGPEPGLHSTSIHSN